MGCPGRYCYSPTHPTNLYPYFLGSLALHPSTFRTLVAYHSGRYLAYLKDHGAYVDEERPRPEDRPAGYTPRSHIPRLRHSLRIVQHLHDRAAPRRLSKLLLSYLYLYTNGIPVLTLHDGVQAQLQLAANRSPFSTSQLESHDIDTNMSISSLLSNSSLPPHSLLTSSNLFLGRNSRLARAPWVLVITLTCLTFFSPFSPLWMLSLLLTFPPLLKRSQLYSYRGATVPLACSQACSTRKLSLMKLLTNISSASLSSLCNSLLLLPSVSLLQTS